MFTPPISSGSRLATGAILVGGRSRRMGFDKALLELMPGVPLIAALVGVVAAFCDEILLVGGDEERFEGFDFPARWVADLYPGKGPIGGIVSALHASRHESVLVLACDAPFVNQALVRALLDDASDADVVAYPALGSGFEPLIARYQRRCLPRLEAMVQGGQLRAQDIASAARVSTLTRETLLAVDPRHLASTNLNTPEDLQSARDLLTEQVSRG